MTSMTPLLEATGLTVFRGDEPLFADVDLSLKAGEVLQIEGSNGSGKTTLLRILCALAQADEGEVFWRGGNLRQCRAGFYAETLYLGHKAGIKAELSAVENLRFYQTVGRNPSSSDRPKSTQTNLADSTLQGNSEGIERALQAVRLSGRGDLPCSVLSAGQQRRVALARLLLTPASLWILDEPLTALDIEGRDTVRGLLEQHVTGGGSLIYTTHQALPIVGKAAQSLNLDSHRDAQQDGDAWQ